MAEGPKPFYGVFGPTTTTQAPGLDPYPHFPEPPRPPEEDPVILGLQICEECNEPIYDGEVAVEILLGFLAKGKKSGRWMIEQLNDEMTPALVHDYCSFKYCMNQIVGPDSDDYDPDPYSHDKYCSGCRERLED